MTLQREIQSALVHALEKVGVPAAELPQVAAATDARFGDYQSNVAMIAAKVFRRPPRQLAEEIVEAFDCDLVRESKVAGPGFINFRLRDEVLAQRIGVLLEDERCGVEKVEDPQRIVIDFSAPNVAKPMHVGHIRSTILGDALARIARFLGHEVITDNHIGDWGTQFGMVIYGWKHFRDEEALAADPIAEFLRLYRQVNALTKEDPSILEECRRELVALQSGDDENRGIWQQCVDRTRAGFQKIYDRLDIHFDHTLGESYYHDRLEPLVEELLAQGIAEKSEGAICIFFPDNERLADKPCLIRKGDGGFLYATTDLATIDYRLDAWKPAAIWYVTGAPQQLHFEQIFAVAQRRGCEAELKHIAFGSILGPDRKMMKTRSGENVQLQDVLDEAVERARARVEEKNPNLDDAEKAAIAEVVGIGAVKYAELSQFRMTDYIFSWDKMLALQGNTAPYLQNAYVRIASIFRKLGEEPVWGGELVLQEGAERALALHISRFGEVIPDILDDFRPNILANYLYELAEKFHSFYEACPVLRSEGVVRETRLALCELTAKVLRCGLSLMGIDVVERM